MTSLWILQNICDSRYNNLSTLKIQIVILVLKLALSLTYWEHWLQFSTCFTMTKDVEKQSEKKKLPTTGSTWSGFWLKLRRLLPYMWPSDNPWLQMRVVFCVLLLIVVRVINVLVPIYYKKIVDTFSYVDDQKLEEGWPLTRHHALPVPPRATQDAVRPTQQLLNLIAAGQVIKVFINQLYHLCIVSEFLI